MDSSIFDQAMTEKVLDCLKMNSLPGTFKIEAIQLLTELCNDEGVHENLAYQKIEMIFLKLIHNNAEDN